MKTKLLVFALALLSTLPALAQWQQISIPDLPSGVGIRQLYMDPAGGTLWAGGTGQLFKSNDNGETWTNSSTGLQSAISANTSIVTLGSRMYASFQGNGNYFTYVSADGGANWEVDTAGWTSVAGVNLSCVQLTTHKEYVLARLESNYILYKKNTDPKWSVLPVPAGGFATPATVYSVGDSLVIGAGNIALTTDMGAHWTVRQSTYQAGIPLGFINGIAHDMDGSRTLLANYQVLSTSKPVLMISRDNQITWDTIHMDIPAPALALSMYIKGNHMIVAYVGSFTAGDTTHKCFRSIDGGATWTNITGNLYSFTQFKFHSITDLQVKADKLFACGFAGGILKTTIGPVGLASNEKPTSDAVYPIPCEASFTVDMDLSDVVITDISGRVLMTYAQIQSGSQIPVSWNPGMVFLQGVHANRIVRVKLLCR